MNQFGAKYSFAIIIFNSVRFGLEKYSNHNSCTSSFSDLQYPNWICGLIPYEWKSTFRAQTTFSCISSVLTIHLQRSFLTLLDLN